jgi:hypothetical protein
VSATAAAAVVASELRELARRRWPPLVAAAGLVVVVLVVALSAGGDELGREDGLRSGVASLLLLGGLVLAVGLGAGALNRDADSGRLGLLAAGGSGRAALAGAVVAGRLAALLAVLAAWSLAAQVAALALGLGADGPLAVHALTMALNLVLALLACALVSSVVGTVAAGAFGLGVYVLAQAVVNLEAAADQNLVGTAEGLVRAAYLVLPRAIVSPMIFTLQAREEAGPAAPPVEINDTTVFIPASSTQDVLWTILWCAVIAVGTALGLRRRPLA